MNTPQLPAGVRYLVAGGIGFVISLLIYEAVYWLNPLEVWRAPSSWMASYVLGIVAQHALHHRITFIGTSVPYARSLRRSLVVYPLVLAASTVVNWLLTEQLGYNHRAGWLTTVLFAAGLSFVFLRSFAFVDDPTQSSDAGDVTART